MPRAAEPRRLAHALFACGCAVACSLALVRPAHADAPPIIRYAPGASTAPPVSAPVGEAREEPSDEDIARQHHLSEAGGFEVTLATGIFRPPLASATFRGSGVPSVEGVPQQQHVTFAADGRDFGMYTPTGYGGSVTARYLRRYLAVGFFFGGAGGFHADGPVADERVTAGANPAGLYWLAGGVDLEASLPVKPVTFRAGVVLGVGSATVSLSGFAPTTCHSSKRGDYPCVEKASATVVYVQPRIGFDVALGNADTSIMALGGYVGWNVIPQRSLEAGVTLTVRTPQWDLMP